MSESSEARLASAALLLDTHAWVWWLGSSPPLPSRTRALIDLAAGREAVWVSAISVWEVALLVQRGRLELREPVRTWVSRAQAVAGVRFLPIDPDLALRSVELQGMHADPADRFIVASAERLGAVLVTRDERIRAAGLVVTLWDEESA